ncbi:class I SAM-dependent methyltransferase [Patescibacteria group bacterium]|nr:class I SAM-dependent methyltransferase [Patescibacteria group bacterium]MBU1844814.1 class I SAM-dependent methyltransferase [Patescibacteria group bacterium]
MSDKHIIKKFRISSKEKVLDIGGSMKQHEEIKIHTLVDIIHPEEAPYGSSKLEADNFIRLDITRERLPFKNNEFDFCLCTHTLEDLSQPFLVLDEMSRVAKRGYIATPSMGKDMEFSHFDITNWLTGPRRVPGNAHHKWFFTKKKKKLQIIPKNYPVLYTPKFHIVDWLGENETRYYWEEEIDYMAKNSLNIHELIDEYEGYLQKHKNLIKRGKALLFLDNPYYIYKAILKFMLRRGKGYKHRKLI